MGFDSLFEVMKNSHTQNEKNNIQFSVSISNAINWAYFNERVHTEFSWLIKSMYAETQGSQYTHPSDLHDKFNI